MTSTENASHTEATINVSLKGPTNDDSWLTIQGAPDDVLRTIWKLSPAARPLAEQKDFFGAVYAANADYKRRKTAAATVTPGTVTTGPTSITVTATPPEQIQTMQGAVALAERKLGATVVETTGVWDSGPSDLPADTSPWGGASDDEGPIDPSDLNGGNGPAPVCPHGTKTYYQGVAKTGKNAGKPYEAWLCPADRNDPSKCSMEFIN